MVVQNIGTNNYFTHGSWKSATNYLKQNNLGKKPDKHVILNYKSCNLIS